MNRLCSRSSHWRESRTGSRSWFRASLVSTVSRLGMEIDDDILFLIRRVDIGGRWQGRYYLITNRKMSVGLVSQAYKLATTVADRQIQQNKSLHYYGGPQLSVGLKTTYTGYLGPNWNICTTQFPLWWKFKIWPQKFGHPPKTCPKNPENSGNAVFPDPSMMPAPELQKMY